MYIYVRWLATARPISSYPQALSIGQVSASEAAMALSGVLHLRGDWTPYAPTTYRPSGQRSRSGPAASQPRGRGSVIAIGGCWSAAISTNNYYTIVYIND